MSLSDEDIVACVESFYKQENDKDIKVRQNKKENFRFTFIPFQDFQCLLTQMKWVVAFITVSKHFAIISFTKQN